MPTLAERIQFSVTSIEASSDILHDVANGGISDSVSTAGGSVPSVAKKINDIGAAIVAGHNNGYLIVVADAAGRAAAQAGQIGQMLWQRDTDKLYIADSTDVGDFSLHPLQTGVDSPSAAIEALEDSIDTIAAWKNITDPNGDGVVDLANALKSVNDATAPQVGEITVYGKENTGSGGLKTIPVLKAIRAAGSLPLETSEVLFNTYHGFLLNNVAASISTGGQLRTWGSQPFEGVMGRGINAAVAIGIGACSLQNNVTRPIPSFSPIARRVVSARATPKTLHALLDDGTIVAAGPSVMYPVFGSNSSVTQRTLQTIFFNQDGANALMTKFDVAMDCGLTTNACTLIAADDSNPWVWILTTNLASQTYVPSGVAGAQNIPVRLQPAAWAGKTVSKVRCLGDGGILVLLNDASLYGCAGYNNVGFLGTGNTSAVLQLTLLASSVTDFEVVGDYDYRYRTLFILQGSTLKAAGYNEDGILAQGNTTNSSSFVTVSTDVQKMRCGGDFRRSLILQKTNGTFHAVGWNGSGLFGNGATTNLTSLTALTALDAIHSTSNVVDWCIGTYNNSVGSTAVVLTDGRGYATGSNTFGQLGVGNFDNRTTWGEVLWTPVDSTEKLVSVQLFSANSVPHFIWRTNLGRTLVSGYDSSTGLTTGHPYSPAFNTSQLCALPL